MEQKDKELIDHVFLAFGSTLTRLVDDQPIPPAHVVAAMVRFLAGFIASRPDPAQRNQLVQYITDTLHEQIEFYLEHGIFLGQAERPN